ALLESLGSLWDTRELREEPTDPQAQQEIINSIEEVYFSNDSFDIVKYELERLPPVLSLQELEEYRDKLKQQQAAVSKKVADLILEKQPAYVQELERVTSLQTGLQLAAVICTNGRSSSFPSCSSHFNWEFSLKHEPFEVHY
uniref:Vacuolar protein sorting-associated protein 54 N-terminal domain-containing protein n=1 Tax=Accipiter nisus TaxID=211598 RepID=A0A8B9M727_9AVES